MDDKQERPVGNNNIHDPLPYKVQLRMTLGEDSVPQMHEWRGTAYSLSEAMFQAFMETSGTALTDGTKIVIESIGPDEPEYWFRILGNAVGALIGNLKKEKK